MSIGLLNAQYNCVLYVFNLVSIEVDGSNSVISLGICVPDKYLETGPTAIQWEKWKVTILFLESNTQSDTTLILLMSA